MNKEQIHNYSKQNSVWLSDPDSEISEIGSVVKYAEKEIGYHLYIPWEIDELILNLACGSGG